MSDEYNSAFGAGYLAGLERAKTILNETAVGRPDGWAAHDEAGALIEKDIVRIQQEDPPSHAVSVGPMPEESEDE